MFDYGIDHGDRQLDPGLDESKKLQLTSPVHFYGREYSTLYVLGNGAISFEQAAHYRPNVLPGPIKVSNYQLIANWIAYRIQLIAPFWNKNDLRNGGSVFFREITSIV